MVIICHYGNNYIKKLMLLVNNNYCYIHNIYIIIYIDIIEACVNDVEVPESRIDELFQLVDKDQLRPDL